MRPDRVAEPGGVLGVVLAVDQHQRSPLVVLDDVRQAVEILQNKKMLTEASLSNYRATGSRSLPNRPTFGYSRKFPGDSKNSNPSHFT